MPLGTLDRTPPPFFRQGASALSRLIFFTALALFLMVADTRLDIAQPIRAGISAVVYPVQWLALQPVLWVREGAAYFRSLRDGREDAQMLREQLRMGAPRVLRYEQLAIENERLRRLLDLRAREDIGGLVAQVLYDAADAYAHKIVIDKGLLHGVMAGAPVLDDSGVLGQVTKVYPSLSEVTLVIDAEQAVPVINTRTGVRAVAFGDPALHGGSLELRYMGTNADVQPGDLLTTSGIDGAYPAGLPVARVDTVVRRVESPFALINCIPQARVDGATQVLVLQPLDGRQPPRPSEPAQPTRKGQAKGAPK